MNYKFEEPNIFSSETEEDVEVLDEKELLNYETGDEFMIDPDIKVELGREMISFQEGHVKISEIADDTVKVKILGRKGISEFGTPEVEISKEVFDDNVKKWV